MDCQSRPAEKSSLTPWHPDTVTTSAGYSVQSALHPSLQSALADIVQEIVSHAYTLYCLYLFPQK